MRNGRPLAVVLTAAALAIGGYLGAQFIRTAALAEPPDASRVASERRLALLEADSREPRFVGEVDGLFLAPRAVSVPDEFVTHRDVCGTQPTREVSPSKAGVLHLSLELPDDYVLDEQSLNTGVIACGQEVYAARWNYKRQLAGGGVADIVIGRGVLTHEELDVAARRVRTMVIGGRDAIVVKPVTSDGIGQNARVVLAEPFGVTFISASDLPFAELITLAELVVSST